MNSRLSRCVATVLLVAFPALSCQTLADTTRDNPKAVLGSLGGAAAGAGIAAIAGGSAGWIVAAGLAGALLGGAIGHRLDNKDKQMAAEAAARAFETNRTGQTAALEEPRLRQLGLDHADQDLSGRERPVLPRVPAGRDHRRREAAGVRHGLPPARRKLEDPELMDRRSSPMQRISRLFVALPRPRGGARLREGAREAARSPRRVRRDRRERRRPHRPRGVPPSAWWRSSSTATATRTAT